MAADRHPDNLEGAEAARRLAQRFSRKRSDRTDSTQSWTLKIDDLRDAAGFRGRTLLKRARRRFKQRKILNLLCGLLALFSGASITAIIADLLSSPTIKVLSACGATLSGSINLILTIFLDDEETRLILDSASLFLALQNKASVERDRPDLSRSEAHRMTYDLMNEYVKISAQADRFQTIE